LQKLQIVQRLEPIGFDIGNWKFEINSMFFTIRGGINEHPEREEEAF